MTVNVCVHDVFQTSQVS